MGEEPSSSNPQAPSPRLPSEGGNELVKKVAAELYEAGFNIVPVGQDKRPLGNWSAERRLEESELRRLLGRASGVAIVGGPENPFKRIDQLLLIVDIDRPSILDRLPRLRELVERTARWLSGPRCPKCEEKHLEVVEPGRRFRCPKCGAEFTLEEARRGIGALFFVDAEAAEKLGLSSTERYGDVELLLNNYALIPPSLHPTGVRYEWVKPIEVPSNSNFGIVSLGEEDLAGLLSEVRGLREQQGRQAQQEQRRGAEAGLRELSDEELVHVYNKLKQFYLPGRRQNLVLYLSGWMAMARVHPLSAVKLVKMLHDWTKDEDPLKQRLAAVVYSYKKAGIDIDQFAEEIERLTGVRPYGLDKEIDEGKVKGKGGLQELIEDALASQGVGGEETEARALDVIRELEEVFGRASPFSGDSVIEVMDFDNAIFAVNDVRSRVIARAVLRDGRLRYREKVISAAITSLTVYDSPMGGVRKFEMVLEGQWMSRPLRVGPATLPEIVERLKAEGGLVNNKKLLEDVLNTVISGMIRRGRAEVRSEVDAPGFYFIRDGGERLTSYKVNTEMPSEAELREGLEVLNSLGGEWFRQAQAQFATVLRWGAVAPFGYALKQKSKFLPWLLIFGWPGTGKTTMGQIVLHMHGVQTVNEKPGAAVNTQARLGQVLSGGTLPVLINEPGDLFTNDGLIEMLKAAADSLVARGKFVSGSYVEIPALAPLIFTSNREAPKDGALLRRLIIIQMDAGMAIPEDRQAKFREEVVPQLPKLAAVGRCVYRYFLEDPNRLLSPADPLEAGRQALEWCYRKANMEPPEWLGLVVRSEVEDPAGLVQLSFASRLTKYVNDLFARYYQRDGLVDVGSGEGLRADRLSVGDKLRTLVENGQLPGAFIKGRGEVAITRALLEELGLGGAINLRDLAAIYNWEYDNVKLQGGKVVKAVVAPFDELAKIVSPEGPETINVDGKA